MRLLFFKLAALALVAAPLGARAANLYDGALNTAPETQGYLTYGPSAAPAFYTLGTNNVTFDTTPTAANKQGWSNYKANLSGPLNAAFPTTLDSAVGFDVLLSMKMLSESHSSTDRAGISLIALDKNHKGVEIAFWADQVWAQQDGATLFTHSTDPLSTENSTGFNPSNDPTSASHEWAYDLHLGPGGYTLSADGAPLLQGPIKDYSAFAGTPNVYALPNFIFLGDDTTSAAGSAEFSALAVSVPEPASLSVLGLVGLLLPVRRGGRRKRQRTADSVL